MPRLQNLHLANKRSVLPPDGITVAFDRDGISAAELDEETCRACLTVPGFDLAPEPEPSQEQEQETPADTPPKQETPPASKKAKAASPATAGDATGTPVEDGTGTDHGTTFPNDPPGTKQEG